MANRLNSFKPAGRYLAAPVTALALAVSGQAMAEVTLYGRAHVSVDYLDDGAKYSKTNVSSNSSRLGFKGTHEISPELTAFFQIEQQINFTTGSNDGDSASFSTRDTFVGLQNSRLGAIQVGRFDSPFKTARGPANLFGDQVGDMRNLTRVGNARFDERYDNTVQYSSPTYQGFGLKLAYSVYEGQAAQEKDDSSNAASLSLNYAGGPLTAALAYEKVGEDNSRGKRNGVRLAGSYKVMDDLKLVGFYQTIDYKSGNSALRKQLSSNTYGLGGEYMLGKNTALKAMWMTRDADDSAYGADMWVVGVEHKLDKAVRVYANYAFMDNNKHSKLTPWAQARSAKPGATATGSEAAGLSVGLRYDF